jgi:hypothetical protein
MATLYQTDFEGGTLASASMNAGSVGTVSVQSTITRAGTFAGRADSGVSGESALVVNSGLVNHAVVGLRCYIYIHIITNPSVATGGMNLAWLLTSAFDQFIGFRVDLNAAGQLGPLTAWYFNTNVATLTASLAPDTWHLLEAYGNTTNAYGFRLNGGTPAEGTGTPPPANAANPWFFAKTFDGASLVTYYDDILITDQLAFPGPTGPPPQYARPSVDLSNADGWTEDDGTTTTIYDQISDTSPPLDDDYIRTAVSPTNDVYVTKLTSVTDPGTDTGHILRYRYKKDLAEGQQVNLTFELRQGYVSEPSSLGTLIETWTETNISGTDWVTQTRALSPGVVATITNYGDLAVRILANAP